MITANGYSPAEAIKEQFTKAGQEISQIQRTERLDPHLATNGPSLLVQCDNAIALSKMLVTQWSSVYVPR